MATLSDIKQVYALLGEICNVELRCMQSGSMRAQAVKVLLDKIYKKVEPTELDVIFTYHSCKSNDVLLDKVVELETEELG